MRVGTATPSRLLVTQRTLAKGTVSATALRAAGIEYLHLPQMGNPRDNRDSYRNVDAQIGRVSVG